MEKMWHPRTSEDFQDPFPLSLHHVSDDPAHFTKWWHPQRTAQQLPKWCQCTFGDSWGPYSNPQLKTIFVIISEIFTFRCAHEFFFLMVQKHKLRQWHEPLQSCLSLHGHTFAKSKTKRPVPFKYMLDGPELLINVLKSQPRAHIFLILCVTE